MVRFRLLIVIAAGMAVACTKRPAPAPPPPTPAPAQNIFALLPDPEGRPTSIVVTNRGGAQEIRDPNHAVRIDRADTAPTAPFSIDERTVTRLFRVALDAMPSPEARFLLYFDEASDTLNSAAQATMAEILNAVRERRSTDIGVTGHTDRTGTTQGNYQLALRRAERVAAVLRTRGVEESSLFVTSHGESDPLFKTGPGGADSRNRRVEVIVH